jgi:hypothetical protein
MMTLLVLAAGIGSRYGGFKQIDPLGEAGEIAVDYALYDAWQAGFGRAVFVTRPELADPLRRHFADRLSGRLALDFVFQDPRVLPHSARPGERQKPWGTGHAVWSARGAVDGPFGVVNADDFYGRDAYRRLAGFLSAPGNSRPAGGAPEYAVVGYPLGRTLSPHGAVSRAVCQVGPDGWLEGIVERTRIGYIPDEDVANSINSREILHRRGAETQRQPMLPQGSGVSISNPVAATELPSDFSASPRLGGEFGSRKTVLYQQNSCVTPSIGWQDDGGDWHELRGDEPVSMNMWGFTPAVFPQLEREFAAFLAERGADPKAEFYIPWALDRLLRLGACRVRVLPTDAEWFGMTYPEDRPEVQVRLRSLTARGEYPHPLWR